MRFLVFVVLISACGGAESGSDAAAQTDIDAASTCITGCPPCTPDSICVTSVKTGSTCVKTCETSTDCPEGLQCAELEFLGQTLLTGSASLPSPVCVSAAFPEECGDVGQGTCSDHAFVTCLDGQRLATGFTWAENESCGSTITTCENGCQSDADAGVQGVHAGHCR